MISRFIEKVQETPTDWSFRFTIPEGFEYKAGQYSVIRVPHWHEDYRNNVRTCSTSSSPTEKFLQFTFTIRKTGFKDTLMEMAAGTEVDLTQARGKMTLESLNSQNVVMIAGGIGVAPFRGMIKYAHDQKLQDLNIRLLYSDKTIEELAFKDEFDFIAERNNNIKVIYTLTRHADLQRSWIGRQGRINAQFILEHVDDFNSTEFMVCGPVEMVRSVIDLLIALKVPQAKINAELFTGY